MERFDCLARYGIKKTKQRTALLEIIMQSAVPLTAADIYEVYREKDTDAAISTIYRTLDLFTKKGIVNKMVLTGEDCAQYELNRNEHKHYAVCKGCNSILNLKDCPIENTQVKTDKGDFYITGHHLELFGYCEKCHAKKDNT
jgi:Fur family transcriptional regulator, ferric uptake regulator